MKCKYCGANLQLTDAFCPYCGKPNPRAERYAKDKQYYEQDYAETSQKVKRVWKLSYDWMTRGITLVVLGVLVFCLLFVTFLADDHSYYKKQKTQNLCYELLHYLSSELPNHHLHTE